MSFSNRGTKNKIHVLCQLWNGIRVLRRTRERFFLKNEHISLKLVTWHLIFYPQIQYIHTKLFVHNILCSFHWELYEWDMKHFDFFLHEKIETKSRMLNVWTIKIKRNMRLPIHILLLFSSDNHLDFLPLRCWIGLWTAFILLLIVAFDLSALVRYITRFTEESFACLIAVIFIAEAFKKLVGILKKAPVNTRPDMELIYDCECFPPNSTSDNGTLWNTTFGGLASSTAIPVTAYHIEDGMEVLNSSLNGTMDMVINWTTVTHEECTKFGGELIGEGCDTPHYVGDVFFLSVLLFLGTFVVASSLTGFKNSSFFPTFVSSFLPITRPNITVILLRFLRLHTISPPNNLFSHGCAHLREPVNFKATILQLCLSV